MKKFSLMMLSICFCAIFVQGQTIPSYFRINSFGKMYLGDLWIGQDQDNVLSGSVFGPNNPWKGGAKLAFGDFGRQANDGWNVFIGEYGDPDGRDDKLWLHGKWGIYLTTGGQGQIPAAYCNSTSSVVGDFYFAKNIWANDFKKYSDIRFKKNVRDIERPLSKILLLNGHSYDYDDQIRLDALIERHLQQTEMSYIESDEYNDSGKTEPALPEINNKRMGFIAQELQKVFPDLVSEDDLGFLGIDYIGLIPVIVEAMKEQQIQIEHLQSMLYERELERDFENPFKNSSFDENSTQDTEARLFQNIPNPFSSNTEIHFEIPQNVITAKLLIHDMQGTEIKSYTINTRGAGNIIIQGSELKAGMYMYTLLVNNTVIDTKKMILTK